MSVQVTIGGDRLRSGSRMRTKLSGYGYSSHDLSTTWRSTQNFGTVVPCFKQVALKGDTWHISTSVMARTLPTQGALFGSAKAQVDFFFYPMRLAIGALHNNMNGVGMQMERVKFPEIKLQPFSNTSDNINRSQISPDSLLAYLGIRGVGNVQVTNSNSILGKYFRPFNATPILGYYDIAKNFYINKQEQDFAAISTTDTNVVIDYTLLSNAPNNTPTVKIPKAWTSGTKIPIGREQTVQLYVKFVRPVLKSQYTIEDYKKGISITLGNAMSTSPVTIAKLSDLEHVAVEIPNSDFLNSIYGIRVALLSSELRNLAQGEPYLEAVNLTNISGEDNPLEVASVVPAIKLYDISQLDQMRNIILKNCEIGERVIIGGADQTPDLPEFLQDLAFVQEDGFKVNGYTTNIMNGYFTQNGLVLKSYLSDIFNNWVRSDWVNEINEKTKIQTQDGLTLDSLAMSRRAWTYLNRVAISGGSYQDWEEAVTGTDIQRFCESPIFMGGMSFDIVFDEVVSTAASGDQPLGTLGGRGNITNVKGGNVTIKAKEYGYILAMVSYTPRIDYYQGNDWDMFSLDNMGDLYKPEFGGIGFQDIIQEQMAFWTTNVNEDGTVLQKTHGKIPAWMNYMTNYNRIYGDFAKDNNLGYMVITRDYKPSIPQTGFQTIDITDLTTIIDPTDFSYLFSSRDLESQPLWTQIRFDAEVRRIMSAAIIPSL